MVGIETLFGYNPFANNDVMIVAISWLYKTVFVVTKNML